MIFSIENEFYYVTDVTIEPSYTEDDFVKIIFVLGGGPGWRLHAILLPRVTTAMSDRLSTEEKIARYRQQGYCRAHTAHHPEHIRQILKTIGLYPNIKECFANCQRFVLGVDDHNVGLEATYHEGYVFGLIPFEHAWVEIDGEVLELTLDDWDRRKYDYRDSYIYTVNDIRQNVLDTHHWEQLTSPSEMAKIHPLLKGKSK